MDCNDVKELIKGMYCDDFTMDSFRMAGALNERLSQILSTQMAYDNYITREGYLQARYMLNDVVFLKLKEKLDYENETINKIVKCLPLAKNIDELYVIDGYLIIKTIPSKDNKVMVIPEEGFTSITSNYFHDINNNLMLKKLIVNGINSYFNDRLNNKNPLSIDKNKNIKQIMPNFNIYLNTTLSNLSIIKNENNGKVIKMFVEYNSDIYYFDIKFRDDYLIIYPNEYAINKLSTSLNEIKEAKAI